MPLTDAALHALALFVYPGLTAAALFGTLTEAAVAVAVDRAGPRAALAAPLARLRRSARSAPALVLATPLLASLAAVQLAVPFNPVSPVERNLLVAVIALAAAAWLGFAWAWTTPGARAAVLAQACWLVALLAPALLSQSLRPQALGAVVVPAQLPLKAISALLALLCLPAVLQLLPDAAPDGGTDRGDQVAAVRAFLWLPACGLLASVVLPPGGDDLGGLLRFLALSLAVAGAAIGLALAAGRWRRPGLRALYAPLAAAVLAVAIVTSLVA